MASFKATYLRNLTFNITVWIFWDNIKVKYHSRRSQEAPERLLFLQFPGFARYFKYVTINICQLYQQPSSVLKGVPAAPTK